MDMKVQPSIAGAQCNEVTMNKGIRQGAPESMLLFVLSSDSALEDVVAQWSCEGKGFRMDGVGLLNHLIFADDMILFCKNLREAKDMLEAVVEALSEFGLEISIEKCQWMSNRDEWMRDGELIGHGLKVKACVGKGMILVLGSLLDKHGGLELEVAH